MHLVFPRYICMLIFDYVVPIYGCMDPIDGYMYQLVWIRSPIIKYSCCMQDAFIFTFCVVLPQRKSMKLHHLKETKG